MQGDAAEIRDVDGNYVPCPPDPPELAADGARRQDESDAATNREEAQ